MLNFLPALLVGAIATLLMVLNALFWVPLLLFFSLLKLALPVASVRRAIAPVLLRIAESWIWCNSAWMALTQRTEWDVAGLDGLDADSWYMVNCNHQSWVDILVLQHLLNRRIPLLKFFLKQQLIWVPVMGLAWWALDFPFMRRHGEEFLKKHPEMRGKDQETTRKACEKFALIPTSVMNFLEGTRFTPAKHARQQSPYTHLLKPKAGGMALALNAMGDKFQAILDITIVYPDGIPTFWLFLQGNVRRIVVRARVLPIPRDLMGADYSGDPAVRAAFQAWVQQLWREKDGQISGLLKAQSCPRRMPSDTMRSWSTVCSGRQLNPVGNLFCFMGVNVRTYLEFAILSVLMALMPAAQAGIIEELLAVPAIQSLLGRQPELQAAVQRCGNANFRQRNTNLCEQAEAASRLAKVPPELRTLLANPAASASIRELCLAVQSTAAQNSYLCSELVKADSGFRAMVEQRRQMPIGPPPQPESSRS